VVLLENKEAARRYLGGTGFGGRQLVSGSQLVGTRRKEKGVSLSYCYKKVCKRISKSVGTDSSIPTFLTKAGICVNPFAQKHLFEN
jgi:hypothetical protein